METDTKMDIETAQAAAPDVEPPSFSHYRLEWELGRGFSSIVYAAQDHRRHRTVALKVLTFLQTLDEERRADLAERFRREALAISTLSHPNIVAVYDFGPAEDGRQFIAMECLAGETLRQRLNHAAPLSVPETVAIGVRVAEALHYAHGRGIIHRDVKPDNIFLAQDDDGGAMTPKLMDFGIAHVLSDQALTQEGTVVGSPAYMSPEQIHGQPLDVRTDVFSLAATLTEMVTGTKPFEAETIPAVMQKILHHAPDLRAVPDRHLQRVLAKALAKNPGARYPDASAFAEALRQTMPFAAPAPSVATHILTGPSRGVVPVRSGRYTRRGVIGAGCLAVAALAALPLVVKHPPPAAQREASAYSPPSAPLVHLDPLPLGAGVRRPESAAVRRPASRLPLRRTGTDSGVRITEVKPTRSAFPQPLPPARAVRPAQSPEPSFFRAVRRVPNPHAHPRRPNAPLWAASIQFAGMHNSPLPVSKPTIRVADSRQELTPAPAVLPASPLTHPLTDAPPRPVYRPMPKAADGMERTDAVVRIRLSIDEYGDVSEADILESSGSRALDDAALDAVGHWEYDPAFENGKIIPGSVVETVKFDSW